MSSIRVIQGDFEKKLKLQFAPGIKAGFPSPAQSIASLKDKLVALRAMNNYQELQELEKHSSTSEGEVNWLAPWLFLKFF